jgi:hypothetical protein
LKDFTKNIVFAIDGDEEVDVNVAQSIVRQYWKDVIAGWRLEHPLIPSEITRLITRVCPILYHYAIFQLFGR